MDRPPLACAVLHFHESRHYLLECLRLLLKLSQDVEYEEEIRGALLDLITIILETKYGPETNGFLFIRKCLAAMDGCEKWLQSLAERIQRMVTLGETATPTFDEIMDFQQENLTQQHESLGAIVTYLVKGGFTGVDDFRRLLDHMPNLDRWGALAVHYVPILMAMVSQYGSSEGSVGLREARVIHTKIMEGRESKQWPLTHLQAAVTTWWLAEYSGRYSDQPTGSPLQGVDLEAEAQSRSEVFFQALHDGAFQCTLSMVSQSIPNNWSDPARAGLTRALLGDTTSLASDVAFLSVEFRYLLLEQVENFANALITHMPDTLRRFKMEEDDQRRKLLSGIQSNVSDNIPEHDRHLERFLLIMSYAYDGRLEAAEAFWGDLDSNLYGFLQWASRRQSTPCVSAFCELFRAISTGDECSSAAHRFLMEEGSVTPGRQRRTISLSWSQIFEELDFYASRIRDHPVAALPSTQISGKSKPVEVDEPESPVMLECYLRLITHLCGQSGEIRTWIISHPTFRIIETLFSLCGATIPPSIRACTYTTFRALLTERSTELGYQVWGALDQWVSSGFANTSSLPRPSKISSVSTWAENVTFESISRSFEESNAFVSLLQVLVSPSLDNAGLDATLPFPEQLGSNYRMSGVEPYIDLILGKVLAELVPRLGDHQQSQVLLLSNVLHFVETCLDSFNEDLIIIANRSKTLIDNSMSSSLLAYTRLHPFSRTIEWLFNERVLTVLFTTAHQDIHEVTRFMADSPLNLALLRCIRVMSLVMDLQTTYLEIVRPLIKLHSSGRRQPVLNSSLTSFEDSVSSHLQIVIDLGLYCGSGQKDLTIASLDLLKKLSVSRKLNAARSSRFDSLVAGNRPVAVLRQYNDLEPISRSMVATMGIDRRELDYGPLAPGYDVKLAVLGFLEHILAASPETPNIAHILLGFDCVGDLVVVPDDGLFAKGSSLFHAVLHVAVVYPNGNEDTMSSWSLVLKQKALQILKVLWTSPLTSIHALSEMRTENALFALWLRQQPIEPNTRWNELSIADPAFIVNEDSALAMECYLRQRRLLFEYAGTELRLTPAEDSSRRTRIMSTLFGSTETEFGIEQNLTLFDLLDFLELDILDDAIPPMPQCFSDLDLSAGTEYNLDKSNKEYNIRIMRELIELKRNSLLRSGQIQDAADDAIFTVEAQNLMLHLVSQNNRQQIMQARISALKAWVDLATLALTNKELDEADRSAFVLQALQIVTPKLELYASSTRPEAVIFARYAQTLLAQVDELNASLLGNDRTADIASDRLFQLFRVSVRAIQHPDGDEAIRETLYGVCFTYLTSNVIVSNAPPHTRSNLRNVRAAGSRLIDIVSDDAYGGEGTCRIAAVLLLDALTTLAIEERSNYMVESLVRTNFITILVETISDIPEELRDTPSDGE